MGKKVFGICLLIIFLVLLIDWGALRALREKVDRYSIERVIFGFKLVYSEESPYQKIFVVRHPKFGRTLVLNNPEGLQIAERDAYQFDEVFHTILIAHPHPKDILIIGCGDGGIIKEILKHPVERVVQVELDERVIEVSKKYLPLINRITPPGYSRKELERMRHKKLYAFPTVWDDSRVRLIIGDGRRFLQESKESFDIIICDLPGPNSDQVAFLYTREFYRLVKARLNENGLFMTHASSSHLYPKRFLIIYRTIAEVFGYHKTSVMNQYVTYLGLWSFVCASRGDINPLSLSPSEVKGRIQDRDLETFDYTATRHFAYFALPNDLKKSLKRLSKIPVLTDDKPIILYVPE